MLLSYIYYSHDQQKLCFLTCLPLNYFATSWINLFRALAGRYLWSHSVYHLGNRICKLFVASNANEDCCKLIQKLHINKPMTKLTKFVRMIQLQQLSLAFVPQRTTLVSVSRPCNRAASYLDSFKFQDFQNLSEECTTFEGLIPTSWPNCPIAKSPTL